VLWSRNFWLEPVDEVSASGQTKVIYYITSHFKQDQAIHLNEYLFFPKNKKYLCKVALHLKHKNGTGKIEN
jgi:hypothetical protein